ncbi:PREDICTED: uncharacterized protein LOC108576181 [Habropoda laboriosa]|uniref:uncharacterized protein LOC108576181 n=1 Tax=Habropoda laboriosa TaxID=597456 RepID=UPI00083CC3A9|nr:PREDICTED: uncharacterized protein LOC108576181 [Habropoda laboriosa]
MLFFGILSVLLAVASANYCYDDVGAVCGTVPPKDEKVKNLPNCSAKYGSIVAHLPILQSYANTNIAFSMDFLLMSSYFGNYEYQREGFQKLYRKYSDEMWEDAIDVIKYLAKRGGTMDFEQLPRIKGSPKVLEMNELSSLAKALDSQKLLANEAMHIYTEAQLAHTQDKVVYITFNYM